MSSVRFSNHNARRRNEDNIEARAGLNENIKQNLEDYRRKIRFKQVKFSIIVLSWQAAILIMSMLLLEYNPKIPKTQVSNAGPRGGAEVEHMARITTFIIVFISIFCGWPCLLHFMAGFAKTGVVLSSVTGCLVFQTAVILRALTWIAVHGTKHEFSLHDLTEAVLVTASFHISSLSLLGRIPPLHLLMSAAIFLPGQSLTRTLQLNYSLDPGASGSVHLYSSVFGVTASVILFRKVKKLSYENYVPSSVSLTGSFLITMSFLIINGLGVNFAEMERSVVNTVMVQSATTTSAAAALVAYSSIYQSPLRFEILQGSLLVGGITSGAIAATQLPPWACLGVGLVLGMVTVLSSIYLEPMLSNCLDTPPAYISLSVHGLPAFIGGLIGVLLAAISEEKTGLLNYGISLYILYPARTPAAGWTCFTNKTMEEILLCPSSGDQIRSLIDPDLPTNHWTALEQAGMQMVSLTVTIIMAVISGSLTGAIVKHLGSSGSAMPVEAWYDGTCFLDTPSFHDSMLKQENTRRQEALLDH